MLRRRVFAVCLFFILAFSLRATAQVAPTPVAPKAGYTPITGEQRFKWAVKSTIGLKSLALSGVISAGWGTIFNKPPEYGTNFDGFAKRYGMRLTGVSTGNAIEASLGMAWGEDPRYFRVPEKKFWDRVGNTADLTFRARRPDGKYHLAYARYTGTAGNNFLSNIWRVESESSVGDALSRTATGFAGKFASNLFDEFWPDVWKKLKGVKF
jgi:hypothetical protein